jgi:prolyl oligopeptidase
MAAEIPSVANYRSKSEGPPIPESRDNAGPGGFAVASYPPARRGSDVGHYHGEAVPDPYRWLEDSADPEAVSWAAAQNELTESLLARVPSRQEIRSGLTRWRDYPRLGVPFERGGRWFQTRGRGLQSQPVLYVMESPGSDGRVLIDPNPLSADGTVAVVAVSVSPDGSMVAYAISESGSDWMTWHLRDVASGADLPDELRWCKSEDAKWAKDGSGFYYAAKSAPRPGREYLDASGETRVLFHRPGSAQEDDEIVYACAKSAMCGVALSADGQYLVLFLKRGIGPGGEIRVLDLGHEDAGWRVLVPAGDAYADVVASAGSVFYLLTDDTADQRRIVAIDAANLPAIESAGASPASAAGARARNEGPGQRTELPGAREIVPACADTLLEAHFFGGRLVCHYLRDACSLLRAFELDGTNAGDITLPGKVTLSGSPATHDQIEGSPESDTVHFEVESFTESASLWRHDLRSGQTTLVRAAAASLSPDDYRTERVTVTSADGTEVPLFLTRRRDLQRRGDVPVLLYGYGSVGIPMTPGFFPEWAVWVERGGMLAVACLRGGGEYGRAWHDAGRRADKQNTFDDFCACARWLASSGWSRADRIAINGGSSGGLLVGACLTQHPELFGAAVADAGVFDMLRFPLFTVGRSWIPEHGDPGDPAQYQWLRSYSPLHNVTPRRYPPVLLTTSDHDDRVVPGHSFKFAATLQAVQRSDAPVLLRVETAAGHSQRGKPAAKAIAEATDRLSFLEAALGIAQVPQQPGQL